MTLPGYSVHIRWHVNRKQYQPSCPHCKSLGVQPGFSTPTPPKRHKSLPLLPVAVTGPKGPSNLFASNPNFFIYGLHAGDCVYRYVGTSRNPYTRLHVHKSNARTGNYKSNHALYDWVREIGPDNLNMDLLDGPIKNSPERIEREWCFFFHTQGYQMLNLRPEYLTGWRINQGGDYSSHVRWHTSRGLWNPHCADCVKENPDGSGLKITQGSSQAKHRL